MLALSCVCILNSAEERESQNFLINSKKTDSTTDFNTNAYIKGCYRSLVFQYNMATCFSFETVLPTFTIFFKMSLLTHVDTYFMKPQTSIQFYIHN